MSNPPVELACVISAWASVDAFNDVWFCGDTRDTGDPPPPMGNTGGLVPCPPLAPVNGGIPVPLCCCCAVALFCCVVVVAGAGVGTGAAAVPAIMGDNTYSHTRYAPTAIKAYLMMSS